MSQSSTTAHSSIDNKHEEESKDVASNMTWAGDLSMLEGLDETVVSRNSFCIFVGAYLRKHAVSPKNVNLK